MRATEIAPRKLVIFDIDDTLVHTQTEVHVVKNGKIVDSLNSHDFTHYQLQPGESFDFRAFRDAKEFFEKSRPIIPMINQLKHDIATGNKVAMVTARADLNDKELFLDTFRKYGIDMSKVHVYRAGNMTNSIQTEEKKKIIIRGLLNKDHYSKAIMYDDAIPNLESFLSLKSEYPDTAFYAWYVSPEGKASEYQRSNESITESTSLKTTITAIASDIGEPVATVYATMANMAKRYVEKNGDLKGFNFISGGVGSRWFQTFYVNKIQSELYDLVKFNPQITATLKNFLRGRINSVGNLDQVGGFGELSNALPNILIDLGTKLNAPQLTKSAQIWIKKRDAYRRYLHDLEFEPEVAAPVSNAPPSASGHQQQQVDKIVNDVLKSLPSNIAGDIRNAIARSPNKLLALQQALKDRNITP
jgi:hypothetical protein